MRKPVLIIGALAAAGFVAFAGGSAFTNSNSLPSDTTAGYGSVTASGVSVSDVHYVQDTTDPTVLSSVVFTTTSDYTTPAAVPTATVSLSKGAGVLMGTFSCVVAPASNATITCDVSATATPISGTVSPAIIDLTSTALTVLS